MRQVIPDQIVSSKQASRIELVPNQDSLRLALAERLAAQPEGGVLLAPPVFIFSVWVEEAAVRLRQLSAMAVPSSQDAYAGLLAWTRKAETGSRNLHHALELNAARHAREADRLLRHWHIEGEAPWLDEDFYRRRQHVHARMAAENVFGPEDWISDLSHLLEGESPLAIALPREIVLRGFIEFTPLESKLIRALERRDVAIHRYQPDVDVPTVNVMSFSTPEDEWQAAAAWAKSRIQSGAGRLCVVLGPEVTESSPTARRVRQLFAATFNPVGAAALADLEESGFCIPAGGRLLDSRAIRSALLLLRLSLARSGQKHPFAAISQWLMSPHWAGAHAEGLDRARLELRLRERGRFQLSLGDVLRQIQADGLADQLPQLARRLGALPSQDGSSSPAERFHAILTFWGWPGSQVEGATDVRQPFLGFLERLEGLEVAAGEEALKLLEAMCAESSISFGGGPLSAVQVLPPEVAAGGRFDGVWVCHLDDASWPPAISPNPCLPAAMRNRIPRLNPEGQFEYYRNLTRMLCGTAPEIRLSWSRDAGQGPRNMSGLLQGLDGQEVEPAPLLRLSQAIWPEAGRRVDRVLNSAMDAIEDEFGVPFPESECIELPGGADFFRLQAACPLWAYMRHRLGAEFSAMPSPTADPAFRGTLLHRALRALYADCAGGNTLPREKDIAPAVDTMLAEPWIRERLTATGLMAEAGRLKRALAEWLKLDGSREGFQVESLEEAYSLALGRATIKIRVDRIDRLADGRRFLLDYKSSLGGKSKALKWLRPRIQEPQLPLYAVLLQADGDSEIGGLSLASVQAGRCGYDGISDDSVSSSRGIRVVGETGGAVKAWDWSTLSRHWRQQSELLRDEILWGRADNRVYDADALRYCDLALVLRHEDAEWFSEGEDDIDAD